MLANEPSLQSFSDLVAGTRNSDPARTLEESCSLSEVLKARRSIEIHENLDPLVQIPSDEVSFADPHPYVSAGAPYGSANPFTLRQEVVLRLLHAQEELDQERPGYKLHIFDGFRPQTVQTYMRQFEHDKYVLEAGLNPAKLSPELKAEFWEKVDQVWSRPSEDPLMAPPHSTAAVVDLSIVDENGKLLNMGSEFDEPTSRIHPNYYSDLSDPESIQICANRELLNKVMSDQGFHRIPHEWWHFSYGDQIWALLESLKTGEVVVARYGEVEVVA